MTVELLQASVELLQVDCSDIHTYICPVKYCTPCTVYYVYYLSIVEEIGQNVRVTEFCSSGPKSYCMLLENELTGAVKLL